MPVEYIHFKNLRKLAFTDKRNEDSLEDNCIEPGMINIFCGPNGSGKSTILDIIRVLSDPELLKTLSRENMRSSSSGSFLIELDGGKSLTALFSSRMFGKTYACIRATLKDASMCFGSIIDSTRPDTIPSEYILTVSSLGQCVARRSTYGIDDLPLNRVLKYLNLNAQYLSGTAASPLKKGAYSYNNLQMKQVDYVTRQCFSLSKYDPNALRVWFNDDIAQTNQVKIDDLPAGWKALAGLLAWLSLQKKQTICIIEEPEVHLHPKLQRVLAIQMQEIATRKSLQLFISTHSTVFLDFEIWKENVANLYITDGRGVKEFSRSAELLAMMGIRPGDVFHANGVIWIEGPSDRIYIKHWLKLYCVENKLSVPIENINYMFVLYGGALMKHLSADRIDMIQTVAVNRNSIFVADNDNDYDANKSLSPLLLNSKSYKEEIRRKIPTWITQGYTIENYLPDNFRNRFFVDENNGLKIKNSKTKVTIASIFENEIKTLSESYNTNQNLVDMIKWIHSNITMWNSI
ncbi:TPA: AAA family ATPase [Enterobacter cloacae]|uniref:ATP-dependent nuclease n=1 Tax=Enterobacter cloacae complex sp. P31C TaxID=2779560 RepID=UPI001866CE58|nr:AAA family ATPase [Enterobacter cloacae complex sp. P31C]MBE3289684.1 AAA family ATPase [Enterobacter cloacae complex sp. P31C]HEW9971760.1 AAA family ATPase [Enterobacter cloacae]